MNKGIVMIPYFSNEHGTLYYGNAIDVTKRVKPESVQCVACSPPYWGKVIYGAEGELGLDETPEDYIEQLVEIFRNIRQVLHPSGTVWLNIGDTNCVPSTVRETTLKMKPGVPSKNRIGIPWRVAFALQKDGWHLRCDIVWWRRNSPREPVRDRPTYEHEYIFLLTKKQHYFYDKIATELPYHGHYAGDRNKIIIESGGMFHGGHNIKAELTGRNLGSVWDIPTQGRTDTHYAAFPDELAARCIKAGTSLKGCCSECHAPIKRLVQRKSKADPWITIGWKATCNCNAEIVPCTVLDPFSGRGTTLLMAEKLYRRWIGIELNPKSCELIKQNFTNRQVGLLPLTEIEDGLFRKDEIDVSIL
jgi:site-specific DNA-methyltransferase (adenine-specific)